MQFKDIIGQESLQKNLVQIAKNNRTHHTQLFVSKSGQGGLPFVLAYAQYLLCTNRQDGDSCGECNQCRKMSKMIHPDVRFTFPTVTKSGISKPTSDDYISEFRTFAKNEVYGDITSWLNTIGNKTNGKIRAVECLEIIKTARYKKLEGNYKINIIWLAEWLGKNGNRLLKILEEPPEDTIFLLVTEDEERILNTILSRSQIHRLAPVSQQAIENYLQKKYSLTPAQAKKTAVIADGSIQQANHLAETIDEKYESVLSDWFQCIIRNKPKLVAHVSSLSNTNKDELKNLMLHGTQLCREALILRNSDLQGRLPEQEQKIAVWLGKKLSLQELHQLSALFEDAIYAIERNANTNVLLMSLSLEIDEIILQRETVT